MFQGGKLVDERSRIACDLVSAHWSRILCHCAGYRRISASLSASFSRLQGNKPVLIIETHLRHGSVPEFEAGVRRRHNVERVERGGPPLHVVAEFFASGATKT
jgi:hypothetical protein